MKHLGDITKINGHDVPLVDVVTGGSPCQDLSVAGKRAGLGGERSGLFMEQIRVIKEMRDESIRQLRMRGADEPIRPRFMVWENVPGAFSSNKGEDFRCVLEETAKIASESAIIPRPEGGRWTNSGCIMGSGWSIAWRVHDAQFWGVPQRRKRVSLVADFGGQSAPKILFERQGLPRDSEKSADKGQEVARDIGTSTDSTSYTLKIRGGVEIDSRGKKAGKGALIQTELSGTLGVSQDQTLIRTFENNASVQAFDTYNQIVTGEITRTLTSVKSDCDHVPVVCLEGNGQRKSHNGDGYKESEIMYTLNTIEHHAVCSPIYSIGHDVRSARFTDDEKTDPLTATDYKDPIKVTYQNTTGALDCGLTKWSGNQLANSDMYIANSSVVRRLTPMECERLQGYPDHWTDIGEWTDSKGKKHKDADSPRYKALGNSIALPFWEWMAGRICNQYDRPVTMASLFDGIGGFPLVFSRHGATPVWASEIEEFPIAVTKIRFPE